MSCPVYRPKKPARPWGRAGIIPVSRLIANDGSIDIVFLLGKEHHEKGWAGSDIWTYFGGLSESVDNTPEDTAAREAYEESMGILGSVADIKKRLETSYKVVRPKITIYMPYYYLSYNHHIPDIFKRVYDYFSKCLQFSPNGKPCIAGCPEGYTEKVQLKWFTLREIEGFSVSNPEMFHPELLKIAKMYERDTK